jgi:hypothetical protein
VDNVYFEKQQRLFTEPLYSSWSGPGGSRRFLAMAAVRLFRRFEKRLLQPDSQTGWGCGLIFGSAHPGAMQSVFCDGSVHTIRYDINPGTWVNLCCRNDGQEVDTSEF